ncbi:hypothetical protein ACVBEH_03090 [Roseateles sp. GG27B]
MRTPKRLFQLAEIALSVVACVGKSPLESVCETVNVALLTGVKRWDKLTVNPR